MELARAGNPSPHPPIPPPACPQGWLGTLGADALLAALPASQMGATRISDTFKAG